MITIDELAIKHNTDKSGLDHQYTQFYQKYFDLYLKEPKKILELGIYTTTNPPTLEKSGASLKTWAEYYPNCMIYGLDLIDYSILDKNYKNIKTLPSNCEIRTKNDVYNLQDAWLKELYTNTNYNMIGGSVGLEEVVKNFGSDYDVIIDDGPHTMSSQQIFLGYMFKYLKSGGIFVIEDLHTSNNGESQYNKNPYTNKTTLWMIKNYLEKNVIESDFMTKEEINYLNNNIKEVFLEKGKNSEIVFILKK